MKNKINSIILMSFLVFLMSTQLQGQVLSNGQVTPGTINAENPFLDASTNFDPNLSFSNTSGKGLLFPRTDLTSWEFSSFFLDGTVFPTAYDGMIVYNTGTGTTLTTGNNPNTSRNVVPGFYYFSNPNGDTNLNVTDGEWLPFVGGSDTRTEISTTEISETTTIINGTPEKVVILPGTATGNTTEMTLDVSGVTNGPLSVTKLREAKIYEGNKLIMIASGDYVTATNTLVTGDGMVNKLLPDIGTNAYTVELYFE